VPVWVNSEEQVLARIPEGVHPRRITFSPDGRRVAYLAKQGASTFLMLGDERGEEVLIEDESGDFPGPIFSADGKHFAYGAGKRPKEYVVLDGKKQREFSDVRGLEFSPDGEHLSYKAQFQKQQVLVLDGVVRPLPDVPPEKPRREDLYEEPGRPGRNPRVVIQGKPTEEFQGIGPTAESPDKKRLAYVLQRNPHSREKETLFIDHKQVATYDLIGWVSFSPDGSRFACVASEGGKQFAVVDGVPQREVDIDEYFARLRQYDPVWGSPVFSPDSKHVAYLVRMQKRVVLFVDQTLFQDFEGVLSPPVFHSDSRQVGFGIGSRSELKWRIVKLQ
jgi:roadblock/LC7 domain-containing protein